MSKHKKKCLCDHCGEVRERAMKIELTDWTSAYKPYVAYICVECVVMVEGKPKLRPGGVPAARARRRTEDLLRQLLAYDQFLKERERIGEERCMPTEFAYP